MPLKHGSTLAYVRRPMKSATRGNHVGIIMRNAGHYRGRQVPREKVRDRRQCRVRVLSHPRGAQAGHVGTSWG